MRQIKKHNRQAFTLIELLVVIAIIALLLSIIVPSLRKAKESAQSIVCRNHLKTLAQANLIYTVRWKNWYVPVIDTTMTARGEPTWNSNTEFREIVGLQDKSVTSNYIMPAEYLCPADRQSNDAYWAQAGVTYKNYVSYGYNLTDWSADSKKPVSWSGNIPVSTWSCRLQVNDISSSGTKIMFIDSGDIWVIMSGANYTKYWDKFGQDIVKYRTAGTWYPTYFRHKQGANAAFFDGHVDFLKKEALFYYTDTASTIPDQKRNENIWFCNLQNRK
ncbi:MAG: prepilin-type N-terminal cleavage/methylation domain-containing protein [Planctomycetes bacterium]|nr:prepilin-type N-terminal cleavage/methylation domain-containing protein [Planctomycetota bacterium]